MRRVVPAYCGAASFLLLGACAGPHAGLPPLPESTAPPMHHRDWAAGEPAGPMSDAANAIMAAFNQSRAAPLGPMSPPPTAFENSCAPEPYVFQSNAGYEAVRVKDCQHDQLLYLPARETARVGRYVEECKRVCSGQSAQTGQRGL